MNNKDPLGSSNIKKHTFSHDTNSEQSFRCDKSILCELSWTPSLQPVYISMYTRSQKYLVYTSINHILPWNSSKSRCCGSMLAAWRTGCDGDGGCWSFTKMGEKMLLKLIKAPSTTPIYANNIFASGLYEDLSDKHETFQTSKVSIKIQDHSLRVSNLICS